MTSLNKIRSRFSTALAEMYTEREAESIFLMCMHELDSKDRKALILEEGTLKEDRYDEILEELLNGRPIQYIIGRTLFYELELKLGPGVLIPRPETEELVNWVVEEHKDRALKIMDVGTGSGCIALAVASTLPKSEVWACDISEQALEIATDNGKRLGLEVNWLQLDALNHPMPKVDVIISNPPYIPRKEKMNMHPRVVDHEPELALFVDDHDPLIFYRKIIEHAKEHSSICYFEIHENMSEELKDLLNIFEMEFEFRKDLQDKIRMLKVSP